MIEPLADLPPAAFDRRDDGDDQAFYAPPRLVTPIDAAAVAALSAFYARTIPANAVVRDLMSSLVGHLPDTLPLASVVGHGMNAVGLAANPRLDRWFVAELNRAPVLPPKNANLDAALCCVGVRYLQRPIEDFAEMASTVGAGSAETSFFCQPGATS